MSDDEAATVLGIYRRTPTSSSSVQIVSDDFFDNVDPLGMRFDRRACPIDKKGLSSHNILHV